MPAKQSQHQVISRMVATHGDKYDYSHVLFTNSKTKVKIVCKHHGIFMQTPEAHIRGQGCPACRVDAIAATNIARYGVPFTTLHEPTKRKGAATRLRLYGHENPAHGISAQQKIRHRNMLQYGVEHNLASEECRTKITFTSQEKYGTQHPTQRHIKEAVDRLGNWEWLHDQYVKQNKTAIQIAKELGVAPGTVGSYIKQHKIPLNYAKKHSAACIRWLDAIARRENIHIMHAQNGGEYCIPGTKYRADGYCVDTNTIYEFYGDLFHGNPAVFAPHERCHPYNQKTAGELYHATMVKERVIRDLGYNLVSVWESDC